MKTAAITGGALFALQALAFPSWLMDRDIDDAELRRLSRIAADIEMGAAKGRRELLTPGFDAEQQYVSTSGDHKFVAPGPHDLRGPCPGLNAMANHGYIPHNGVATIGQFIEGTYEVFGMGKDLGAFLSIYGAVFDGDLTSWSIGGAQPEGLLGGLLDGIGLLSRPQGLSGSHNKYESDVSPTRGDLYEYGDASTVVVSQFEDLYSQPLGKNGYDLTTLTNFRAKRFEQSIQNNPYFFNGPFSGVAVQPAAYTFIYRYMGNKSEEHPEGYLDGDVLKSFFSITGDPGSFKYTEGHERIPENWYKRAIGDEYGLLPFILDLNAAGLEHVEFFAIGGNTGRPDSFTGVDLKQLTKGVFDATTLLDGDNLGCFIFQVAQQTAPDILKGLFGAITKPLRQINDALDNVLGLLTCPELREVDMSLLKQFPGSKGAY